MNKTITIKLKKSIIHNFVDASTYKRSEATLNQETERTQDAVSSDVEEDVDGILITEYCDRRDAQLRRRLKFCLVDTDPDIEFDNVPTLDDEDYEYVLNVEEEFTSNDARSVCKMMDSYIKRGAIFDWFLGAGLQPSDTEIELGKLEDEIVSLLRGRPWGKRPMQPFGPKLFNYYKK